MLSTSTRGRAYCTIPSHFVLQQLDYVEYIDLYHERIRCFHVKDAEFRPNGRTGVYGGYQGWANRAGRFRSTGDGQVDWSRIFTQLTKYGYQGWATLEWECCFKAPEQGAAEGAPFIRRQMITPATRAFDDFAGGSVDKEQLRRILGTSERLTAQKSEKHFTAEDAEDAEARRGEQDNNFDLAMNERALGSPEVQCSASFNANPPRPPRPPRFKAVPYSRGSRPRPDPRLELQRVDQALRKLHHFRQLAARDLGRDLFEEPHLEAVTPAGDGHEDRVVVERQSHAPSWRCASRMSSIIFGVRM